MTSDDAYSAPTIGTSSGGASSGSGDSGGGQSAPTSPQVAEPEVTHKTPDEVPAHRRARWIRAHAHEL